MGGDNSVDLLESKDMVGNRGHGLSLACHVTCSHFAILRVLQVMVMLNDVFTTGRTYARYERPKCVRDPPS